MSTAPKELQSPNTTNMSKSKKKKMKKKAKKKAELLEKQLQQLEELEENLQINGMNEFSSIPKKKVSYFVSFVKMAWEVNGKKRRLDFVRQMLSKEFLKTNVIERISKDKWLDLTKKTRIISDCT